jgi:AraC-like DNA-binding protein
MVNRLLDASKYLELSLHECGREHCVAEKEFLFTPKTYYLFHYVVAGKGTLLSKGVLYKLHAGDMFYIGPGEQPHYTPDQDDPWTYIWLGFDGSNAKSFVDGAGLSCDNPVYHDQSRRLKDVFDSLYNEYSLKGYFDLYCLGEAYQLMNFICHPRDNDTGVSSMAEGHIKAAKEFILNNYAFHISIDDVAKNVGVTSNYLANIFASYEHSSPKKFLIKVRMSNAALLLKSGSYKVNEVSQKVGYSNQLHFSNEFKHYYGLSPINYQKKQGGN